MVNTQEEFERLAEVMRRELSTSSEWRKLSNLANQICGDPSFESVLASIASGLPETFVLDRNERFVKLAIKARLVDESEIGCLPQLAAKAVQKYASQLDPITIEIAGVDTGRKVLERYLHGLRVPDTNDDLRITDDTPVELHSADGRRNSGYVAGLSRDSEFVYVAFEHEVLPADLPARLKVHRNKNWIDLAARLFATSKTPQLFSLLTEQGPGVPLRRDSSWLLGLDLTELPTPWSRLLWGPPGSGKTYCLASFLSAIASMGEHERVLVVASSNVAVDVATLQIVDALQKKPAGMDLISNRLVLRYGYPRDERILQRPELLGPEGLEDFSKQIERTYDEVRRLRKDRADDVDVAAAQARAKQMAEERKRKISAHVSRARIISTTVAGLAATTCPIVQGGPWQTVILDEASMASGATVLFLAGVAEKRLLVAGDPRQLGPVFEWNSRSSPPADVSRWVAQDPYQMAELSTGIGLKTIVKTDDRRVARIGIQRRCHPTLWSLVSMMYPGIQSEIKDGKLENLVGLAPLRGSALAILDVGASSRRPESAAVLEGEDDIETAHKYESSSRTAGRSWKNPSTAALAIQVAREIRAQDLKTSVAIIAPYRGQVRLISRWLDEEAKSDGKLQGIKVGTVHAFQGAESDVVIFDVVDGPPRTGIGALLRGEMGVRLVNVAVTRARGKLVILADRAWLRDKTQERESNLLWRIVCASADSSTCSVLPGIGVAAPEIEAECHTERVLLAELERRQSELPPFVQRYKLKGAAGSIVSEPSFAFITKRLAVFCDGIMDGVSAHRWRRDLGQRRQLAALGWEYLSFTRSEIMADHGAGCVAEVIRRSGAT